VCHELAHAATAALTNSIQARDITVRYDYSAFISGAYDAYCTLAFRMPPLKTENRTATTMTVTKEDLLNYTTKIDKHYQGRTISYLAGPTVGILSNYSMLKALQILRPKWFENKWFYIFCLSKLMIQDLRALNPLDQGMDG